MNLTMLKNQLGICEKKIAHLKETRNYKSNLNVAQVHLDAVDRMIADQEKIVVILKNQIATLENPDGILQNQEDSHA
jgi:hypothetical protein